MFSCNKKEDFQEQVANDCIGEYTSEEIEDTLVSAFFGLDNALPGLLCNQPGSLLDGMPVNFKFPIDASSLSENDFEVVDNIGNTNRGVYVSNVIYNFKIIFR